MKPHFLCLLLALPAVAFGQEDDPSYGHSNHGEVFNEGPRQAAVLIPGTGDVHFEVTTKSKDAQKFFDQGLGQLHGFWDFEAERSFRQAAAIDPDLAMAYWGMAMANFGNDERAKGFIAEAKKRIESASDREKMWIEALAKYFENEKTDRKKRLRDLVRSLEDIVLAYPDDVEAKAFLAKQLYYNHRKGHPISSHLTVELLIREIHEADPDHPAHHYRIHLWDREKPERALESAAQCGPAAPAIAHMWHMPGHIYSRLHRYDDAVWQQEASARIDHAHMMRFHVIPDQIHNFAHNNEWLIRNLNHLGQVERAVDLACNMIELPRLPKFKGDTEQYQHSGGSWSYGRVRLRDTLLRYEQWDRLLAYLDSDYLRPDIDTIDETEWRRLAGISSFETGDRKRGQKMISEIQADLDSVRAEQEKAEEKKKKDFKSKIEEREKALNELKAYDLVFAEQPDAEAAKKAVETAKEIGKSRKARLYLQIGDTSQAVKLATEDAKSSPGEVHPLATQVWALWEDGQEKEATEAFKKLQNLAHLADLNLTLFERLKPVTKKLGVEGDWRLAPEPAKDLGKRPELAELGPFRWQPPKAPAFSLKNSDDQIVSLSDYAGKPVLVIFFLGRGCTHCMEQLSEFAPMQKKFAKAGIEVVAVSTDTTEGLRLTYWLNTDAETTEDAKNPFLFPLLSDSDLEAFKAYRAYDDFEDMALHGTFLIDELGRVRWQNISYEPFMHPEFMLEESKRLLGFGDS